MRALSINQEPITLDLYDASNPHESLVGLLRFDLLITRQPSRQPAVATMCNHRQRHITVNIEADFAGQAVEVKKFTLIPKASSIPFRLTYRVITSRAVT